MRTAVGATRWKRVGAAVLVVAIATLGFTLSSGGAPALTGCLATADQVAVYEAPTGGGNCAVLGVGAYENVTAVGIADNSVSSIRVGSNAVAVVHQDVDFGGAANNSWATLTANDPDLSNNAYPALQSPPDNGGLVDNSISSLWVLARGCTPGATQVALFEKTFSGGCVLLGAGSYPTAASVGLPNDFVSSLVVGGSVHVDSFSNPSYAGAQCATAPASSASLCFGRNLSSLIVTATSSTTTTTTTTTTTSSTTTTSTTTPSSTTTTTAPSGQTLAQLRTTTMNAVFGQSSLPTTVAVPTSGVPSWSIPSTVVGNVAHVSPLRVTLRFGLFSYPLVLSSTAGTGECLVLFHGGHTNTVYARNADLLVAQELAAGCDVALLEMPFNGRNPHSLTTVVNGQTVTISSHNALATLETAGRSVLDLFIEPIVAVVSWAQAQGYTEIGMTGFSGGGWATHVAAALDERIQVSGAVASSVPLDVDPKSQRDREQINPLLFGSVKYQDLYVLATTASRTQLHILNLYDSCCFAGQNGSKWAPGVNARVPAGGSYLFISDDTVKPDGSGATRHVISAFACQQILNIVIAQLVE